MKKIILLVLAIAFTFSGCEKDDICDADTITTPRLVISFYDINNPSELKSVTDLTIIGEGKTEGITFNESTLVNGSTVSIPLKIDADATSFSFILNYGNSDTALVNEDELKLNYSRENVFVSRACGFKTEFTLDPITPYVHTDAAVADEKWIQYIAVKNSTIDNENETHLEIYF
ncbi:DUF6452 family protein [Flavobacterium degerlachei]|jgi:hypothetical protein|uniref:Uncharacterized protein n=1 Tax=Flavobacterium degerlachei TaxID=229203 RepID=A0A1H2SVK9_9FLAO|nr:DUF6452 family protein [Flavobacterium degerlachei]SDW35703.1 hypothetical protein SAMN05444338_102190 [Flavobacterium degerlachei]